jgi:hypothetical protein
MLNRLLILIIAVSLFVASNGTSQQLPILSVEKSISENIIVLNENGDIISPDEILINLTIVPPNQERVDADVVLAIDCSDSMYLADSEQIRKDATKDFISLLDPEKDYVSVVLWNGDAFTSNPLSNDFNLAKNVVASMPRVDRGNTDFGNALNFSMNILQQSPRANDPMVSRSIIFLTDALGEGSDRGYNYVPEIASISKDKIYRIYTVQLKDYPDGVHDLKMLAKETGGMYIQATNNTALRPIYRDLGKIIPFKILATDATLIDILPPYLKLIDDYDMDAINVPLEYIYTHNVSEKLESDPNLDGTNTIKMTWGTIVSGYYPLTLLLRAKFEQPLPANVVTGRERTNDTSELLYVDAMGKQEKIPIEAKKLWIKGTSIFSKDKLPVTIVLSASVGFSVISIEYAIRLIRRRKEKVEN